MTNQDFINSLSPKATQIISSYSCKKDKKDIVVVLSENESQLNFTNPEKYIIEVKRKESFEQMEYELLHEFFHCVQMDENFPSLTPIDYSYSKIASSLSSTVLDLDVNKRLEKWNYFYNSSGLKNSINDIRKLIFISQNDSLVYDEIHEMNQYINICSMIAFVRINSPHIAEINQLLKILSENAKDFYKTQSVIFNTINKIGFNSPQKVHKVFKTLIRELKLEKYIKIS